MSDKKSSVTLEEITSLCKRRGFIFQGSEIYGGLAGTWDYGPLGVELKKNLMDLWWSEFVEKRDDIVGVDAAILMNPTTWKASGHVDTFTDPLCEDLETKKRYRTDHILKDNGVDPAGLSLEKMDEIIKEKSIKSPDGNELSSSRTFNMMFETAVGPTAEFLSTGDDEILTTKDNEPLLASGKGSIAYLRPETAQGIFTNYKNVVDTLYPDVPFGIAQQGKAFRNEISPRDFVFRSREFEQMEIEYFIRESDWEASFETWRKDITKFLKNAGVDMSKVHELDVPKDDLAHYSKRTIDYEFEYPHGTDELLGLAYRTDFDLSNVARESGKNMEYRPKDGSDPFVPHVIEPSFGVERLVIAVLLSAYVQDDEHERVVLKLPAHVAPVKYCVSPLLKNKPELVKKAQEVYKKLQDLHGAVMWDDNGNIGKRYRRQDEIGTPYCIVIDFDTLKDDTVTVRDRDTTDQKRVKISELV